MALAVVPDTLAAAQRALRTLLDSDVARGARGYGVLYQRVGLVETRTPRPSRSRRSAPRAGELAATSGTGPSSGARPKGPPRYDPRSAVMA